MLCLYIARRTLHGIRRSTREEKATYTLAIGNKFSGTILFAPAATVS